MPEMKKQPERTCVGCRIKKPKHELLRIVRTPEGNVETDRSGRKNGRGAYICPDPDCLAKAMKSGALGRALGATVQQDIYEGLLKEIEPIE